MLGRDGTRYEVVRPTEVRADQPRWWIDVEPDPRSERDKVMLLPATSDRLHLLPRQMFGAVTAALVLPTKDN